MSAKNDTYVFLDTCSLLDSCWNCFNSRTNKEEFEYQEFKERRFWQNEFPSLEKRGKVILPNRNYEELQKHLRSRNKCLAHRSEYILRIVNKLIHEHRIEVVGDKNDPFADAILLSVALKFRTQKNMVFVTQDKGLAHDLESIRRFESVKPRKGFDIEVRRISREGSLERHRGATRISKSQRGMRNDCVLNDHQYAVDRKPVREWWEEA